VSVASQFACDVFRAMLIIRHHGQECVYIAKVGIFDKQYYYIRDYGKVLPDRVYRPEPRFLARQFSRLHFFCEPYCEWRNKDVDLARVDCTSHWVP